MRWFLFVVLTAFSWAARQLGSATFADPVGSALLSLGCLIIGGVLAGELAVRFRAPRITGYLLLGVMAGPHALGLETASDAQLLTVFEELALGLIALTAGGEFRLKVIRRRLRPLLAVTAAHTVGILIFVAGAMWLFLELVPFLGPVSPSEAVAAVALLGVIAVAVSPATTIAVIADLRAHGEMVETVLSVTIVKDLIILLLFTLVNASVISLMDGGPPAFGDIMHVVWEILGSLVVGMVLGAVLGLYIAKVGRLVPLTVLALALASAELAHQSFVEHLLVCMAAGFMARNLYPKAAGQFLDALEQSSTPIYVIFFALIGAGLNVGVFAALWLPAVIYVVVRIFGVWLMTGLPASAAGSGQAMARFGWMGFVAQAGLSLGLAARIQREVPTIGSTVAMLVVAAVVVNQLIGPIMWERAIVAAGEQGPKHK